LAKGFFISGSDGKSSPDIELENLELKKRLREVEMKRDIQKKAALTFSR
jgi:hypothetical protein